MDKDIVLLAVLVIAAVIIVMTTGRTSRRDKLEERTRQDELSKLALANATSIAEVNKQLASVLSQIGGLLRERDRASFERGANQEAATGVRVAAAKAEGRDEANALSTAAAEVLAKAAAEVLAKEAVRLAAGTDPLKVEDSIVAASSERIVEAVNSLASATDRATDVAAETSEKK